MMVKVLVLLWMVVSLKTSAEIIEERNDSNKSLTHIPNSYYSNITKLILHHNLIAMNSLDSVALRNYTKLTELDLSYNSIAWLTAEAFSELRNLELLSLQGNKLQTLNNKTFTNLRKIKRLDLSENPWNCSSQLLKLINWMNNSEIETGGPKTTCKTPVELSGKSILSVIKENSLPTVTTTATSTPSTLTAFTAGRTVSQGPSHAQTTTSGNANVSNRDTLTEDKTLGTKKPGVSNTWKFLAGVVLIVLCISTIIVCAVKAPSWFKMLFNYRHQRLHESEEPSMFNTGRYSNFSLDTEQTETSASELDQGLTVPNEDEDGFIEDGYIQPEDYKDNTDAEAI